MLLALNQDLLNHIGKLALGAVTLAQMRCATKGLAVVLGDVTLEELCAQLIVGTDYGAAPDLISRFTCFELSMLFLHDQRLITAIRLSTLLIRT